MLNFSVWTKTLSERLIHENWAAYFRCPVETTEQAGTTLLPESKCAGEKIMALWHIGKHTFVQLDPAFYPQLDALVKKLTAHTPLTRQRIENAWGKEAISSRDSGFTYYLFPPDLPNYQPPSPFTLRQLTEGDAKLLIFSLLTNCTLC